MAKVPERSHTDGVIETVRPRVLDVGERNRGAGPDQGVRERRIIIDRKVSAPRGLEGVQATASVQ